MIDYEGFAMTTTSAIGAHVEPATRPSPAAVGQRTKPRKLWRSASITPQQVNRLRFTDLPRVWMRGFDFHAISEQRCTKLIARESMRGNGGRVVTPNLHILRLCCRDPEVADLVKQADLRAADGMPLVWASWLQRTPLPERIAGSSLIWSLSELAAKRGLSVYFLGGNEGTAERAAQQLTKTYPDLQVAGHYCPPFGFDSDPEERMKMYQAVIDAEPDIVYVALGCPKQERVMESLYRRMPEAWYLGVGYSFSFVAGESARAPQWMQRSGMEWLHRLSSEPRRLFKRYLVECLPFFGHMALRSVIKGLLPMRCRRRTESSYLQSRFVRSSELQSRNRVDSESMMSGGPA